MSQFFFQDNDNDRGSVIGYDGDDSDVCSFISYHDETNYVPQNNFHYIEVEKHSEFFNLTEFRLRNLSHNFCSPCKYIYLIYVLKKKKKENQCDHEAVEIFEEIQQITEYEQKSPHKFDQETGGKSTPSFKKMRRSSSSISSLDSNVSNTSVSSDSSSDMNPWSLLRLDSNIVSYFMCPLYRKICNDFSKRIKEYRKQQHIERTTKTRERYTSLQTRVTPDIVQSLANEKGDIYGLLQVYIATKWKSDVSNHPLYLNIISSVY